MSGYDLYNFVLCAIVFTALTALLTYLIVKMVKMHIALVRLGQMDSEILKAQNEKKKKGCVIDCIVSFVLCGILLLCFGFSLYVNVSEEKTFENIPTFKVVCSDSMSRIHKKNEFLKANKLTNQLDRFDLILTYKKPKEEDLKLYDIVVYEQDDKLMVVHRIVGIEEPNSSHPYDRYFLCQGDANEIPDKFPVRYSQIKAIYKDERVPFIGSFVLFMQSPAGWLCILLVVFAVIATPIAEKKINEEEKKRLAVMLAEQEGGEK